MRKTEKQITVERWVADDGKEFSNKNECGYHEWKIRATQVFLVQRTDILRGNINIDNIEIFSTKEQAQKAMDSYSTNYDWDIFPIYLDIRFWQEDQK